MGEDLNSSSFRETLKTTTSLRVNDIVLAEFEEDGALYRSAVTDCDGNSFIKVEFVDYGNSAVIKKENTYSLPKEHQDKWRRAEIVNIDTTAFLNLVDYGHYECIPYKECSQLKRLPEELTNSPKVTFPCILHGVKPVGEDIGQWSDEAAVFFQQCFYEKNLQISFREFVSNTHWKVDILADGVHVAKELVPGTDFSLPRDDEEFGLEDEGSDDQSDLLVDSTDESEPEMPLSLVEHHGNVFCREGSNSPAIPNHSA
ncbi:hypothetical protein F7725_019922 [Dissostichus mawsoni]|uniref:Tudor domain-containing protein n=1 Tax=Dissostichus mawsoni TaxID=36200 RepID=A0A7J5YM09_DISMA|nr:hypothetical protein F7725_019922 [Dissostichus mawsoni]